MEESIHREFLIKVKLDVVFDFLGSYPELADKLDTLDLPSLLADNLVVDCDSFAGKVLDQLGETKASIRLADPQVCNVHDTTGEDLDSYIAGPEEKVW
jgi:hypothetical protein